MGAGAVGRRLRGGVVIVLVGAQAAVVWEHEVLGDTINEAAVFAADGAVATGIQPAVYHFDAAKVADVVFAADGAVATGIQPAVKYFDASEEAAEEPVVAGVDAEVAVDV